MYVQKCKHCETEKLTFERISVCTECQSTDVIHKPLHLRGLVFDTAGILELTMRQHDENKGCSWKFLNLNERLANMAVEISEFNNATTTEDMYKEMADILASGAMVLNFLRHKLSDEGINVESDLYGDVRLD